MSKQPSQWNVLIRCAIVCACTGWAFLTSNRGVAVADDEPVPIIELAVAESWPIDYATHHVQGLCVDDEHFYVSSVARQQREGWVFVFDRAGTLITSRNVTQGQQIHPGGMQLVDGQLWVALAEYRPHSRGTVLTLDAKTLETRASFPVDDHIGGVATDGREHVYAANWDSRTIYRFDLQGNLQEKIANRQPVAYQDLEWHDGQLWGVGQLPRGRERWPVVDVLDAGDASLVRRYRLQGETRSRAASFAREGFTLVGRDLYVLPEDGPHTAVYRFPLEPAEGVK